MCSYAALTNSDLIPDSGEASHPHSEPCCASAFFAQTKMVQEYGFEGYVQSDCGAVNNEVGKEHWAANATDAAAKALVQGIPGLGLILTRFPLVVCGKVTTRMPKCVPFSLSPPPLPRLVITQY